MERSLCLDLSVPLVPAPLGLLPSHHHAGAWIYPGPQDGGTVTRKYFFPPSLPRAFHEGGGFFRVWALKPGWGNPQKHVTHWALVIGSLTLAKLENLSAGSPEVWVPCVLGEATPDTGGLDPWV